MTALLLQRNPLLNNPEVLALIADLDGCTADELAAYHAQQKAERLAQEAREWADSGFSRVDYNAFPEYRRRFAQRVREAFPKPVSYRQLKIFPE